MTDLDQTTGSGLSRRTVVKGAAWSLPAIALAVGAPAAAASVIVNVGDFSVDGDCGLLGVGVVGSGFTVTAGPSEALPVGTIITVASSATLSVEVLAISGATADIDLLTPNSATFTFTSALAAGATAELRALLNVDLLSTSTATLSLPSGYVAGDGAKETGTLNTTLILCTDG